MLIEIITLIGILLAIFSAGVSIGRFIEKVYFYISRHKNDRRP